MGVRRIAFTPHLDVALRAGAQVIPRQKLRPYLMVTRKRNTSVTTKTEARAINGASYGKQTSYITSGAAGVISFLRTAAKTASGFAGAGGGSPGSGGSGGWPELP